MSTEKEERRSATHHPALLGLDDSDEAVEVKCGRFLDALGAALHLQAS
jgi:hypothetical protein